MIECEVQSHDAYGTPRELFGKFFGVIAETMRELLGDEWSPEIDAAWRKLLEKSMASSPRARRKSKPESAVPLGNVRAITTDM